MFAHVSEKLLQRSCFVFVYFAVCSIGLIKICQVVALNIYRHLDFTPFLSDLCDWARPFGHDKLPQLLHYGLTLAAFLLFYSIYFLIFKDKNNTSMRHCFYKNAHVILFFATLFLLNVVILFAHRPVNALVILWCILFFSLPVFLYAPLNMRRCLNKISHVKMKKSFYWMCTLFVVIQLGSLFVPLVLHPMQIENDFFDIPEQTKLSSGQWVDNTQYINQHHLLGLVKYDPRLDGGVTPHSTYISQVHVPPHVMMTNFLNQPHRSSDYSYDQNEHILYLMHRAMTPAEHYELNMMYQDNPHARQELDQFFDASQQAADAAKTRIYTAEEKDFLQKNRIELKNQMKAGWFFYHHSWVFNPLHAMSLGASAQSQTLLYGYLSSISLTHLLKFLGGVNYATYFKVTYAFYPLYALLFLGVLFFVFQRIEYVCIAALLFSSSLFFLSDQLIQLAPGFNPIRHFFDVLVFLFFYMYLKKSQSLYLVASLLLGLVSILWSKDFGLFLFLSVLGSMCVRLLSQTKRSYVMLFLMVGLLCVGMIIYFLPIYGRDPHVMALLLGIALPATAPKLTCLILFFLAMLYVGYIRTFDCHAPMFFLSISLFFYLQLELVYFIWYPSSHHFLALAPTLIFIMLTWLSLHEKKEKYPSVHLHMVTWMIILLVYIPGIMYFYADRLSHNRIFSTHKMYDWTDQKTSFQSTMDPTLFDQARLLIQTYEVHPSMYLISKYDTLLPSLVHKYNALPSVSLAMDLLSFHDLRAMAQKIHDDAPQYIFIDSDLLRNLNGERVNTDDPSGLVDRAMYENAVGRVAVLTNVQQLYFLLQQSYVPVERGLLISVYKKT